MSVVRLRHYAPSPHVTNAPLESGLRERTQGGKGNLPIPRPATHVYLKVGRISGVGIDSDVALNTLKIP